MYIDNIKAGVRDFVYKIKADMQEPASESLARLWATFLTARIALALALVLIQAATPIMLGAEGMLWVHWGSVFFLMAYLVEAVVLRWCIGRGRLLQHHRLVLWVLTAGLDLLVFSWLYWYGTGSNSYFMLFVFFVLMISALGARWLIYMACIFSTVLIFAHAGLLSWDYYVSESFHLGNLFQPLIGSVVLFVIGELTFQLSERMRNEAHRASAGLASAKQQEVLNRLIVSEMEIGVLVADNHTNLKMFNPAAVSLVTGKEAMLNADDAFHVFDDEPGWKQLQEVIRILFDSGTGNRWLVFDFTLEQGSRGPCMLQIKGRVLESNADEENGLCVLFLMDMRDVDRRMQQEKLAAMGRMSASIAHEIRNPLATIASANTLLAEGLHDKGSIRLSEMIATNADRLSRIVKDVLDVAHMQVGGEVDAIDLLMVLPDIVKDWEATNGLREGRVVTQWPDDIFGVYIAFDEDHLRRVVINLLDNAARYASDDDGAIFVTCQVYQSAENELVRISIFSDGSQLNPLTEKSLFEPFFSTEARGTGLGLYICRNLCHRYGASLDYMRTNLQEKGKLRSYNEFYITANRVDPLPGETQVLLDQTRYQGSEEG